jgi:rhodanese-related sulfurtransferase
MAIGVQQMVQELRGSVPERSPADVNEQLQRGEIAVVVDVREPDEYRAGHLPGAVNIPRGVLELRADPNLPMVDERLGDHSDGRVVVYCFQAPGFRSLSAADTLRKMGYSDAVAMAAGVSGWEDAGYALDTEAS